jgi:hypothetical protein
VLQFIFEPKKKKNIFRLERKAKVFCIINLTISVFLAASTLSVNSASFTKSTTESNNNVPSTINNNHFINQQQSFNSSHQQIFNNFIAGQNHPPQPSPLINRNPSLNMPKNEPVKLVYPTNNNTQSSTIVTMNNNRVTFTSAPVQNGSITLSPMTANQMSQPGQQQQAVMQGQNIKITGQTAGQQAPTLIFKNSNSSAPGTVFTSSPVTMSKANNNQVREVK